MPSVVIPAFDEATVIERCLDALLADAGQDELEVVVVCNGCHDDTADRARRYGDRVAVVETPVPSKVHALNLGDEAVRSFPRVYLDADVVLTTAAVRDVVARLDEGAVVAAPRAVVELDGRPWGVRAFYDVWTQLPYVQEGMVGSGVYAFSREGRSRFGRFPDLIADDELARRVAAPHERVSSPTSTFTIHPPRTLRGVVGVMTRVRAGNRELAASGVADAGGTSARRSLAGIVRQPRLWAKAPVYVGVLLVADRRARAKLRDAGRRRRWERDETSRAMAGMLL